MEEKIIEALQKAFPNEDFTASDQLIEDGLLDSLVITGIIVALSDAFSIDIPLEEILPENFNSVSDMAKLVERLKGSKNI